MTSRPTEPRIHPVVDLNERQRALVATTIHDRPLNILATMVRNENVLASFSRFGGKLLFRGSLPDREREIVILRVGWNARSVYEFGQHTLIGRDAGLTDAEIADLCRRPDDGSWSDDDLALIALADDLHRDDCVSDATWARLETRWDDAELIELLVVAGNYRLVSGLLNSCGVQLDPWVPGWPTGSPHEGPSRRWNL